MRRSSSEVDLCRCRSGDPLMRTEMGVVDQANLDLLCQILCRQRSQKAQPLAGPPRYEPSTRF